MQRSRLSIQLDLTDRHCVVVGGGSVARGKCKKLLQTGARLTVVSRSFVNESADWPPARANIIRQDFYPHHLHGAFLVIAATDQGEVNGQVLAAARAAHILAARVDDPRSSDFSFAATVRRGALTISFATDGVLPALSRQLRTQAELQYGPDFALLGEWAAAIRPQALRQLNSEKRRLLFKSLAAPKIVDLISRGKSQAARARVEELLHQFGLDLPVGLSPPPVARAGKVFIIGAGPGDPGLITLKAVECLNAAQIVLFDSMVHPLILQRHCSHAEQIDVGKRKGSHSKNQQEITRQLVDLARKGNVVARIKGGDPMVFGRGGEEARALRQAGMAFEIVPGVSCAYAVPAYAGIPLTDREYASSFGVYSAHRRGGLSLADDEWRRIAQGPDTLVFLMGKSRCTTIVRKLIQYGRPSETPIAIIYNGTTNHQTKIVATLGSILEKTESLAPPGPGLIVVGRAVDAVPQMEWFNPLPEGPPPFSRFD